MSRIGQMPVAPLHGCTHENTAVRARRSRHRRTRSGEPMSEQPESVSEQIGTEATPPDTGDTSVNESYHGYSVDDEDQPQASGDSLVDDRGLAEPLDEGYSPPEKWSPAEGYGNTPLGGGSRGERSTSASPRRSRSRTRTTRRAGSSRTSTTARSADERAGRLRRGGRGRPRGHREGPGRRRRRHRRRGGVRGGGRGARRRGVTAVVVAGTGAGAGRAVVGVRPTGRLRPGSSPSARRTPRR